MIRQIIVITIFVSISCILLLAGCNRSTASIDRPQPVVSKKIVIYDTETYEKLAALWSKYYQSYPSEDAYGNWMMAARYADLKDYPKLLATGIKKYPANPTLLYLNSMLTHGGADNIEAKAALERAIQLDPTYMDPVFALVVDYMADNDRERTNAMLRQLLERAAIPEDIMDLNYNVLACLDSNAILLTNGDNDTYPAWILTRIVKYRPDVIIVNRSLMNAPWYPLEIIKEGVHDYITKSEVDKIQAECIQNFIKSDRKGNPVALSSDTLIVRLIESAKLANRPVYAALTLEETPKLKPFIDNGFHVGLAIRLTASQDKNESVVKHNFGIWLNEFRTGGLDSWRLRNAKPSDAGLMMTSLYLGGMNGLLDSGKTLNSTDRIAMFRWYRTHLQPVLSQENKRAALEIWNRYSEIPEIREWCTKQGIH